MPRPKRDGRPTGCRRVGRCPCRCSEGSPRSGVPTDSLVYCPQLGLRRAVGPERENSGHLDLSPAAVRRGFSRAGSRTHWHSGAGFLNRFPAVTNAPDTDFGFREPASPAQALACTPGRPPGLFNQTDWAALYPRKRQGKRQRRRQAGIFGRRIELAFRWYPRTPPGLKASSESKKDSGERAARGGSHAGSY